MAKSKKPKKPGLKGPKPGSDDALDAGCLCPVLDNGHGRGYMGMPGIFVMRADCPLHGTEVRSPGDGVGRSFSSES